MRCLQFTPENTQLNASAKWLRTDSGDHQIQLTPSASDCRGSIWLSVADPDLIDSSRDFAVEFSFRIRRSGADGMALVFHNDPAGTAALGQGGGGLGYAGLTNAIALEIDTYQGVDTCADPNGNHFSLQCAPAGRPLSSHHSQSIACTSDSGVPLPVLNDGSDPLHCLAYYDSAGQTFSVWLSDKPSAGEETTLLCGADYLRILRAEQFLLSERVGNGNRLLIGFTAATGGLSQEHLVLNARVFLQDHLLLS
jgi:hypothetical protein